MTVTDTLTLTALVAVLLVAAAAVWWARVPTAGEVLVHTRRPDDQTLRGVLIGHRLGAWIVLEQARVISDGDEVTLAGGRAVIPRRNVAWVQPVTATTSD
ncbi:MAG: hypothetical protein M0P31_19200 [Solirubrobacteraceae bacterium]|nr:hypothetical protein [Solirubrobacteraceae bacterium]